MWKTRIQRGASFMIHFTCDKDKLISTISVASRTVSQKSTIPALEGIYVTAGKLLTLTGYNLETGISVSMEADVKEMGSAIFRQSSLAIS